MGIKTHSCRNRACRKLFNPDREGQLVCSIACALAWGPGHRHRLRKEALKTTSEKLNEAQAIVNRYIRMRDAMKPCISCGRWHKGQWHAGHYRSRGACSSLRFDEDNIHRQCSVCNNHKSGELQGYREGLLERIGKERLERLDNAPKSYKWSDEEIAEIKIRYAAKIKELNTYFPDNSGI